jgi:hypothetical protein
MKSEIRNPKAETRETACRFARALGLRLSGFGLFSAFGFRLSDFPS